MELCEGGELFEHILKKGTFSEGMAWKIIKQVLSALSYLHKQNIIHSDLKAENIMFLEKDSNDFLVKLIDFGMATKFDPQEKLSNIQGTPYYLAPEVLKGEYDEKADIWSWGVVLYIMLSGSPPFKGKTLKQVFTSIMKHELAFDPKQWGDMSEMVIEFIKTLLNFDPEKRPTAQEWLKMRWVRRFSKNKEWGTNLISKQVLKTLQQFNCEQKLQKSIISYIANFLTPARNERKLRETFLKLDKDKDGVLSQADLVSYAPRQLVVSFINFHQILFRRSWILNKDEVVNYSDFVAAASNIKEMVTESNLKQWFKHFDIDSDGYIQLSDLKNILGLGDEINEDNSSVLCIAESEDRTTKMINYEEFKKIMVMLVKNHSNQIQILNNNDQFDVNSLFHTRLKSHFIKR